VKTIVNNHGKVFNMNRKGNAVIAALILAAALCVCTLALLVGLKKFQNNAFTFIEMQKKEMVSIIRNQKHELKCIARSREDKIKNFIKDELKNSNIEVKRPSQ